MEISKRKFGEDKQHLIANHAKLTNGTANNHDDRNEDDDSGNIDARKSLIILLSIFLTSLFAMFYIYYSFPELNESEKQHVKIPFNLEDAKLLGKVLDQYKDLYYFEVMFAVFIIYIFLQTFAIPGSIFLSILSGFLFNFYIALALVCLCSALGATLCFLLSQLCGRRLVRHFFPEKAADWSEKVRKHKDNMLSYMLFLRVTPLLPNWFINMVAPVIGVPLFPFAVGTFFGVAPPSFIAIQTGQTLNTLTSTDSKFSIGSIAWLSVFAVLSLVPIIFKKYFKSKLE